MAILKLSGIVTKISGKVGGQIFGTGTQGAYLKNNSYSQQPNTPDQSKQRAFVTGVPQIWSSLTPTEKASYQSQVANYPRINNVGDTVYFTAYGLYLFLNQNNVQNDLPILTTAPAFVPVSNASWVFSFTSPFGFILSAIDGVLNTFISVFVSQYTPAGVTPNLSNYRLLSRFDLVNGINEFNLNAQIIALNGDFIEGRYIWLRLKTSVIDNGNTTEFFTQNLFAQIPV